MADIQFVRDCIDNEGFDYAFRHYSSFTDVNDPEFQKLRQAYVDSANALERYVNERTIGEGDEECVESGDDDEE